MGSFDSIVGVSLHTVSYVFEDGSYGSRVTSQFVGNDPQWFSALAPQESSKESFCGALIPSRWTRMSITSPPWSTARHSTAVGR